MTTPTPPRRFRFGLRLFVVVTWILCAMLTIGIELPPIVDALAIASGFVLANVGLFLGSFALARLITRR